MFLNWDLWDGGGEAPLHQIGAVGAQGERAFLQQTEERGGGVQEKKERGSSRADRKRCCNGANRAEEGNPCGH